MAPCHLPRTLALLTKVKPRLCAIESRFPSIWEVGEYRPPRNSLTSSSPPLLFLCILSTLSSQADVSDMMHLFFFFFFVAVCGACRFVLENWMAPSMFSCAKGERSAEHDFLLGYGHSQQGLKSAQARLEKHWDTWVTQDDFAKMASMGINTVRIPIGYWIMGEKQWLNHTPFHQYTSVYQNQLRYLARAIKWASEHDIGVLIDLHGAYGSQNGQAHSGMATGKIHFFDEPHERRTTELLVKLTEMYANVTNVIGIEALNEPNKNYQAKVYPWYHSAMNAMRKANNPQAKSLPIYFHDAFNLSAGASFVKERSDFVVQDTHLYFLYSKKDQRASPASHTADIRGTMSGLLNSQSRIARNNMIVGEWSCALAQNSLQKARDAHSSQSQFCNAQASVYRQHVGGWGFWSWRLESCKQNAGWCFQATEKTRLLTSPLHAWTQSSSSRTSSSPTFAGGKNKRAEAQQMDMDQVLSHIAQDVATMDKPDLPYSDPTSAPSPKSRRRGAGPAALAAWKVRSDATSAHQKASNAGYKDGYATVQQFVSHQSGHRTTSRISLSRMGFSGQFMADRFQAHVSQEALKQEDWAAYQDHFGQGLAAAEAKIAGIVEHHASSSSSASATASASSSSLSSS